MIEGLIVRPRLLLNGKTLCILCLNILIEPRSISAQENGQIIKGGILDKEYLITVLGKMRTDKLDPYFKQV